MKSEILILAPYPTVQNSKDGMISRVKAIDHLLQNIPRTYLNVSLRSFGNGKKHKEGIVDIYSLNFFLHFITIWNLIKSHSNIYSHSIYMLSFLWFLIKKKQNSLTLDLHGVVPEEEKFSNKNIFRISYYKFIERMVFKRLTNAICVTNSMKSYYQNKYKLFNGFFLVYSIIPDNLPFVNDEAIKEIKKINSEKIQVIYSGGTQEWQNVNLMIELIKNNQTPKIHYTILTGDVTTFENKIRDNGIDLKMVTVASRNPSDLWKDYIAADYALILRDDHIVNKVACPTKLMEYLYYGLVPVVLSKEIGDYKKMEYSYVSIENFSSITKPLGLNENNIEIAKKLIHMNHSADLVSFIFKS